MKNTNRNRITIRNYYWKLAFYLTCDLILLTIFDEIDELFILKKHEIQLNYYNIHVIEKLL